MVHYRMPNHRVHRGAVNESGDGGAKLQATVPHSASTAPRLPVNQQAASGRSDGRLLSRRHGVVLVLAPLASLSLAGQKHSRIIFQLADMNGVEKLTCNGLLPRCHVLWCNRS